MKILDGTYINCRKIVGYDIFLDSKTNRHECAMKNVVHEVEHMKSFTEMIAVEPLYWF